MKRRCSRLCFFPLKRFKNAFFPWAAMLFLISGLTHATEDVGIESLESDLVENLQERVNGLAPADSYKIIVDVKAREQRTKVVLEGEVQSKSDGSETQSQAKELPGFQKLGEQSGKVATQKAKRERFTYKSKTVVDKVQVKLILDTELDVERKDLLTSIVTNAIDSAYGDTGTVEKIELSMSNYGRPFSTTVKNWLSSYLGERFGSAVDLAYLTALLALLFFLGGLGLRKVIKMRREARSKQADQDSLNEPKANLPGQDPNQPKASEIKLDEIFSRIIQFYVKSPLEVRRFLSLLSEADKRIFLATIRAPALRNYFEGMIDEKASSDQELSKANRDRLDFLVKDLERYLTIQKEQIEHPFGFLETIDQATLKEFIDKKNEPVMTVALLMAYLRSEQFSFITQSWQVHDKVKLFKIVHEHRFGPEEITRLEAELRTEYLKARESGIVRIKNQLQIEQDILENSDDVSEVLEALQAQNYDLPKEYFKYKITFDEVLDLEPAILKNVVRRVPNETLATALAQGGHSVARWTQILGEVRFKLIDSIRQRYGQADQEKVKKAQNEIMRTYRSLI